MHVFEQATISPRLRLRRELGPRLEPLDPPKAVPDPAGAFRRAEMREKHLDVVRPEAERNEARPRLVRRQAAGCA
jgi:hypothetical protein